MAPKSPLSPLSFWVEEGGHARPAAPCGCVSGLGPGTFPHQRRRAFAAWARPVCAWTPGPGWASRVLCAPGARVCAPWHWGGQCCVCSWWGGLGSSGACCHTPCVAATGDSVLQRTGPQALPPLHPGADLSGLGSRLPPSSGLFPRGLMLTALPVPGEGRLWSSSFSLHLSLPHPAARPPSPTGARPHSTFPGQPSPVAGQFSRVALQGSSGRLVWNPRAFS